MSKTVEGVWQCHFVDDNLRLKQIFFEHIEATHVESPGYSCEFCQKPCRTRNALRAHKHHEHSTMQNKNSSF